MATEDKSTRSHSSLEPTQTQDELSTTPAPLETKNVALTYYKQGRKFYGLWLYNEALAAYDRSLEIDPQSQDTHNSRGIALHKLQRYDEALAAYDRSLKINPQSSTTLNNRGITLHGLQRYDEALAAYDRSLEIDPQSQETHYNRGGALYQLKRHKEALVAIENALKIQPDLEAARNMFKTIAHIDYDAYEAKKLEFKTTVNALAQRIGIFHRETSDATPVLLPIVLDYADDCTDEVTEKTTTDCRVM